MQRCIYMICSMFGYICSLFEYICSMFGEYLYSMSSGYIQCLPENGIMGNLKASETTALIGWLLFNMAVPQEHMEDNLLVDFQRPSNYP